MTMFDYQDENTDERKIHGYLQNIDKNMARQEQLCKAAQTDALTGILNGMASPETEIVGRTERIRTSIETAKEKYPFLGISTGIYLTNVPNAYEHDYVEADRALYETKKRGKGHATIRKETKDGIV